jgi:hypothetical protein
LNLSPHIRAGNKFKLEREDVQPPVSAGSRGQKWWAGEDMI